MTSKHNSSEHVQDSLKLSKRKQAWREQQYADCTYLPLENKQQFVGGRKVILWYPSGKVADDGYVDAEWSKRIEIHHVLDSGCKTYFSDRQHDALTFSRPIHVHSVKVQRDGATQILIFDDFRFGDWQAAGFEALPSNNGVEGQEGALS